MASARGPRPRVPHLRAAAVLGLLGRAVTADCQAVRAVLETVRRLQDALH